MFVAVRAACALRPSASSYRTAVPVRLFGRGANGDGVIDQRIQPPNRLYSTTATEQEASQPSSEVESSSKNAKRKAKARAKKGQSNRSRLLASRKRLGRLAASLSVSVPPEHRVNEKLLSRSRRLQRQKEGTGGAKAEKELRDVWVKLVDGLKAHPEIVDNPKHASQKIRLAARAPYDDQASKVLRRLEDQKRSWSLDESEEEQPDAKGKYLWPDVKDTRTSGAGEANNSCTPRHNTQLFTGPEAEQRRSVRPRQPDDDSKQNDRWTDYVSFDQFADPDKQKWETSFGGVLSAGDVNVEEVTPLRDMEVPQLAHGLDRVLFNPGVHWLRDARSGIYNFDPRIRNLYDVDLFDYSALPPYLTSSVDEELAQLTRKYAKRYSGSTSSLTALLSHIYFCISAWKQPPMSGFTEGFSKLPRGFSFGAKLPASIVLQHFQDNEGDKSASRYAVDNDKAAAGGSENSNYVLTQLGKSVEKMLTSSPEEYEKYLRVNSHTLSDEVKSKKEAYFYSMSDKFLMRSQLDCVDDRLPRRTFDLKTRAVVAVRMDRANWVESSGYMIRHNTGVNESFERELWDMSRGTLLKYFFQARIGNMDGIMVAYHSTSTMFGFQYLSREELAQRLFSSEEMGEQAFRLSLGLLEKILDTATLYYPEQTLQVTVDAQADEARRDPHLLVFVRPSVKQDDSAQKDTSEGDKLTLFEVHVDRYLSGSLVQGPVDFSVPEGYSIDVSREDEILRRERRGLPPLNWSIEYSIKPRTDMNAEATLERLQKVLHRQQSVAPLLMPNVEALNARERSRQEALAANPEALKKFLDDRRTGVAAGMPIAPGQIVLGMEEEKKAASEEASDVEEVQAEGARKGSQLSGVHIVGVDDGDAMAAGADLSERDPPPHIKSTADDDGEANAASVEVSERDPPPHVKSSAQQKWVKETFNVRRLRRLARLGQQDKDEQERTDRFEQYERRG